MPTDPKPTCFVAQPFRNPFQVRYDEDIEPAISEAGMTAYKVDKDLAADKLIEDIHLGIERATIVLADITDDNPNVWYELGYSQALNKPLVMISCSTERDPGKPYPFDVRGRKIVDYTTGTRGAHDKLRKDVSDRIKALLAKEKEQLGTSASPREAKLNSVTTDQPKASELDAINRIRQKARDTARPSQVVMISFSGWDEHLGLPVGTTRRLLEKALKRDFWVTSKGLDTAELSLPQEPDIPF